MRLPLKLCALVVGVLALSAGQAGPNAEAAVPTEVQKLLASDAQVAAAFGFSVGVSGGTAVVGARYEDTQGNFAGAAYVFERDESETNSWSQVKKLLASDGEIGDFFGTSAAVSGDTAVVGANREDAEGYAAGAAYVFQRDEGGAGNWGEQKKLTASDAEADDLFGASVAVSGDTVVVGAYLEDAEVPFQNFGAAYVFQRDEGGAGNWGEVTKLTASDAFPGDAFAWSVAVSGDTAVVGAAGADAAGNNAGAVYVFERDEGGADNWGEVTKLLASDAQAFDRFGFSVGVSGDIAIAGASTARGDDAGAAYVFQRDEGGAGNWGEVTKLTASDAQAEDQFGFSVAVSGDSVVVGAHREDAGGINAGAAYLFQRDEGGADNWGEVTKLLASDAQPGDVFGWSVAVSGDTAVVGAWSEDAGGGSAGAAYVFAPVPPVGGIAELPEAARAPLETSGSSGPGAAVLAWLAGGAVAGALALGGAGWYARRRFGS